MEVKRTILAVIFTVFATVNAQEHNHHDHHENHRVNVAVYYESLCPDSRKFITTQLYPALQGNLSNYVNLTLVPYGKTNTTFSVSQYEFQCHHGEAECVGNKIQACALHLIDNGAKTEGMGYNKIAVDFINCLMDKTERNGKEATFPTKMCAEANPNNVVPLANIESCSNHPDGSNYLANLGKLTDDIMKPLVSVPTIVFNKKFNVDDNKMAQTNFVGALCKYIPGEKPADCANSGSNLKFSKIVTPEHIPSN